MQRLDVAAKRFYVKCRARERNGEVSRKKLIRASARTILRVEALRGTPLRWYRSILDARFIPFFKRIRIFSKFSQVLNNVTDNREKWRVRNCQLFRARITLTRQRKKERKESR